MTKNSSDCGEITLPSIDLTDKDIYEAMKSISGYLDITPGDFKELYCFAYRKAVERIARSVCAKDMMSRKVVYVRRDTALPDIAEIMGAKGISGVPVVDESDKVVGVISEKDFLSRMGSEGPRNFMLVVANCLKAKGCIALPIRAQRAADIMSSPAITVMEETTFMEIAQIFTEKCINRVPVTDSGDRLVGIVSRTDVVNATLTTSCSSS